MNESLEIGKFCLNFSSYYIIHRTRKALSVNERRALGGQCSEGLRRREGGVIKGEGGLALLTANEN